MMGNKSSNICVKSSTSFLSSLPLTDFQTFHFSGSCFFAKNIGGLQFAVQPVWLLFKHVHLYISDPHHPRYLTEDHQRCRRLKFSRCFFVQTVYTPNRLLYTDKNLIELIEIDTFKLSSFFFKHHQIPTYIESYPTCYLLKDPSKKMDHQPGTESRPVGVPLWCCFALKDCFCWEKSACWEVRNNHLHHRNLTRINVQK